MVGHSHWAGIKHKKGRADKERSRYFQNFREITVAAKLGDKNPDMNQIRLLFKQLSRPICQKKTLYAINKSEILENKNYESLRYEGFGPFNTALIIETLTDNKNRSAHPLELFYKKMVVD